MAWCWWNCFHYQHHVYLTVPLCWPLYLNVQITQLVISIFTSHSKSLCIATWFTWFNLSPSVPSALPLAYLSIWVERVLFCLSEEIRWFNESIFPKVTPHSSAHSVLGCGLGFCQNVKDLLPVTNALPNNWVECHFKLIRWKDKASLSKAYINCCNKQTRRPGHGNKEYIFPVNTIRFFFSVD